VLPGQEFGAIPGTAGRIFGCQVGFVDDAEDGGEIHTFGTVNSADLDDAMLGSVVFLEWQGIEASPLQHLKIVASIVAAVDQHCDVGGVGGRQLGLGDRTDEFSVDLGAGDQPTRP
jgi:hypothetical protein